MRVPKLLGSQGRGQNPLLKAFVMPGLQQEEVMEL